MTKRTIKKIAKRYYYGGDVSKYIKYIDTIPENAIFDLARRHGWDGNHWDNPLVLCVNYYEG